MEKLLPSRKFIVTVGSGITIIAGVWFFVFALNYFSVNKQKVATNTQYELPNASEEANKDSDNDGLKDWEEILWKTDPQKADTDGDGAPDGEEIKNSRDPKIPNTALPGKPPTDKLKTPEEIKTESAPGQSGTLTEKISNEFASKYFATKGMVNGDPLNISAQKNLADSLAVSFEKSTASYADTFIKENIKVSDTADTKKYLDNLGQALKKNFDKTSYSELAIINDTINSKDFGKLDQLNNVIISYKKTVAFLKKQTVPAGFLDLHLTLLNSMQNTLLAIQDMQQIKSDPVRGMIGLSLYARETERVNAYLLGLKEQINKNGITFAEKDGGAFFNQYLSRI